MRNEGNRQFSRHNVRTWFHSNLSHMLEFVSIELAWISNQMKRYAWWKHMEFRQPIFTHYTHGIIMSMKYQRIKIEINFHWFWWWETRHKHTHRKSNDEAICENWVPYGKKSIINTGITFNVIFRDTYLNSNEYGITI